MRVNYICRNLRYLIEFHKKILSDSVKSFLTQLFMWSSIYFTFFSFKINTYLSAADGVEEYSMIKRNYFMENFSWNKQERA